MNSRRPHGRTTERIYSRAEMIRMMCATMNAKKLSGVSAATDECVEEYSALDDLSSPYRRLVRLPLDRIETDYRYPHWVDKYVEMYRSGSRFPPIVIEEETSGIMHPYDGHHRVTAAKIVGLKEIEAFVPVRD